jgi:tol-pal system protein YbgF
MTRLSLVILLTSSFALYGQKREDFVALQRDVAQMQDQMKQLQKSQDDKMAALTTLVQQSLDAQARLAASLGAVQQSLQRSIDEQQGKLTAPIASMGTKVDNMAEEFRGVKENIAALASQLSKLDSKLTDISLAVRSINTAPAVAPPAAPTAQAVVVPQGPSAEVLWENARRDMSGGKNELALQELADYVKTFPLSENAPSAQYNIGTVYDRGDQYEDALKAYTAVVDQFPENPRTPDALYMKGVEQMKLERYSDARVTFQDFVKRYPSNENALKARNHLRELASGQRPAVHKRAK